MIEIKYDKGKFNISTEASVFEVVELFVVLQDTIEEDFMFKFAFKMAENYRKDRDAKNNSDN